MNGSEWAEQHEDNIIIWVPPPLFIFLLLQNIKFLPTIFTLATQHRISSLPSFYPPPPPSTQ